MSNADYLFDPDSFNNEFLPGILNADTDTITTWLEAHVNNALAEAQMLETLPRIIAKTLLLVNEKPMVATDAEQGFVLVHKHNQPDNPDFIAAQLVTAALNNDSDTLTGLVQGAMSWPVETRPFITMCLISQAHAAMHTFTAKENHS